MAAKKLNPSISCKQCGASFTQTKTWQFFCSANCRNLYHSKARTEGVELRARIVKLEKQIIALGGTPE